MGKSPSAIDPFLLTLTSPWRPAPPNPSYLWPGLVHIYSLESALCSFILTGPMPLFVLGARFMSIAGGPMFNLTQD